MRVLMINRSDAYTEMGGDVVQMDKTREALLRQGISVNVCLADRLDAANWNVDIVHNLTSRRPRNRGRRV